MEEFFNERPMLAPAPATSAADHLRRAQGLMQNLQLVQLERASSSSGHAAPSAPPGERQVLPAPRPHPGSSLAPPPGLAVAPAASKRARVERAAAPATEATAAPAAKRPAPAVPAAKPAAPAANQTTPPAASREPPAANRAAPAAPPAALAACSAASAAASPPADRPAQRDLRVGDYVRLTNCKLASLNDVQGVIELRTPCGRFHVRLESPGWAGHRLCWVRRRNLLLED